MRERGALVTEHRVPKETKENPYSGSCSGKLDPQGNFLSGQMGWKCHFLITNGGIVPSKVEEHN